MWIIRQLSWLEKRREESEICRRQLTSASLLSGPDATPLELRQSTCNIDAVYAEEEGGGEERRAEKRSEETERDEIDWQLNDLMSNKINDAAFPPSPVPRPNSWNYLFSFEFQFESIHSTRTGIFESAWQWMRVVVTRRSTADAYHRISQPALQLCRPFLAPSSEDDDDDDDWDDDQAEDD